MDSKLKAVPDEPEKLGDDKGDDRGEETQSKDLEAVKEIAAARNQIATEI
jgi:hypothetical protein